MYNVEQGPPTGRPSKYSKKMLDNKWHELLACAKKGGTVNKLCLILGITHDTLYRWRREIPEFSEAFGMLVQVSQESWEDHASNAATKKTMGSDKMMVFMMANNFRKSYATERVDQTTEDKTRSPEELQKLLSSPEIVEVLGMMGFKSEGDKE